METEYNALSHALKSVLPLQDLLTRVARGVGLPDDYNTTFQTTVWENNMGALTLANMEPGCVTPRSKYYAIKMHWFPSFVGTRFHIKKIATAKQRVDILTKGLTQIVFEANRKLLCGW